MSMRMPFEEIQSTIEVINRSIDELQYVVSRLDEQIEMIRESGISTDSGFYAEYNCLSETIKKTSADLVHKVSEMMVEIKKQREMVIVYDTPREIQLEYHKGKEYPANFGHVEHLL